MEQRVEMRTSPVGLIGFVFGFLTVPVILCFYFVFANR